MAEASRQDSEATEESWEKPVATGKLAEMAEWREASYKDVAAEMG